MNLKRCCYLFFRFCGSLQAPFTTTPSGSPLLSFQCNGQGLQTSRRRLVATSWRRRTLCVMCGARSKPVWILSMLLGRHDTVSGYWGRMLYNTNRPPWTVIRCIVYFIACVMSMHWVLKVHACMHACTHACMLTQCALQSMHVPCTNNYQKYKIYRSVGRYMFSFNHAWYQLSSLPATWGNWSW